MPSQQHPLRKYRIQQGKNLATSPSEDVTQCARGFLTVINDSIVISDPVCPDEIAVSCDELEGSDQQEDDL